MKNIFVFAEKSPSRLESLLRANSDFNVEQRNLSQTEDLETLDADLIVIDASSEATSHLLNTHKIHNPILIVSDHVISGIDPEVYDYILKPLDEDELQVRVSSLLKFKTLKNQLAKYSVTDDLTGLYNRNFAHKRLDEELSRSKRYNTSVSCILFDIDFFKVINDMYGYASGDYILKKIGEILFKHARKEDIVARYGDEEFLLILPNTDEDNSFLVAERIRKDVEGMEFIPEGDDEPHPVTVSGGLSTYPFAIVEAETAETIIRYSEHALYNAKKKGKNRIVKFSQINIEF